MAQEEAEIKVRSRIGNFHSKEVFRKFQQAGASLLVLGIITNGVPLYFLDLQISKWPRGRDCNNKSALAQEDFVCQTLKEWEARDYIRRIPLSKAKVVLPLSVAHRWSHRKKVLKHRLVLDCSPLSSKMSYGRIKLPDLTYLRQHIRHKDFIGLIDITSFYLHFTLDPTFSDRLVSNVKEGRIIITSFVAVF